MMYHRPIAQVALACLLFLVVTLGDSPALAAQKAEALPHKLSVPELTVASGPTSPEEMEAFLDVVIFRTILVHGFSPNMGQWFSPKGVHWFSAIGGHWFSPKVGHDGGEVPSQLAYFPFCEQREREKRCLEKGRKPWTFERC